MPTLSIQASLASSFEPLPSDPRLRLEDKISMSLHYAELVLNVYYVNVILAKLNQFESSGMETLPRYER